MVVRVIASWESEFDSLQAFRGFPDEVLTIAEFNSYTNTLYK